METKEIIVSDSNLFFPKDETQIKLSTDVDNSYKETVSNIIASSFGVIMEPESFIPEPMGKIYVSSGCLENGEFVSKSVIDIGCLVPKSNKSSETQTLNEYLIDKFKLNKNVNNNESVKYKYLYNKHLNETYDKISADLNTYSKLFDQGFAKKNTRLKADEEITKSGNTLLKSYPFILGVGAGVNSINLQMVVRSFIIPMERVDLNTKLSVFKYPEWFMNKEAIIDAVEDTIYISGTATNIAFYGSNTNEFGYEPSKYDSNLSNYNIVNFYNRHEKLRTTNNSGNTNS